MSANPLKHLAVPWVMRTVLLLCALAIWELISSTGALGRTTLAAPSRIARAAWTLGGEAELGANLARTLGEVLSSFGLAILSGVPLGVLLWRAPSLFRMVAPFLSALYAVPLLFFYPLLLASFGLGPRAIIAIAAVTAAIPIMLHTRVALLHVRESYWKLGHLYGGTISQRYRKIVLPAATPYLMAGCKLGFAFSMIGAIGMEFVLADRGIGQAVRFNYDLFQADRMYAYICLVVGLAMLCHGLFSWGERRLTRNQVTNLHAEIDRQESPPQPHGMRAGLGIAALALTLIMLYALVAQTQIIPLPIETSRLFAPLLGGGTLYPHLIATLQPTLYGFGLALIAGSAIGAILGRSQYWRQVCEPVVAALYAVPKITLFPVFVLVFGLGLESRVVMAFVHAVFPILIAMMTGVKELNPVYTKLARTEQAGPLQLITKIYLPALGPALVAAVRLGLNLALLGVVLSECFAAKRGLGYLIMDAYAADRLDRMFVMLGVLYALAFTFMLLPAPIMSGRTRRALAARLSPISVPANQGKPRLPESLWEGYGYSDVHVAANERDKPYF
jgi:ABC-type nitrate/sulfonate/bicarbonate transport system permease component